MTIGPDTDLDTLPAPGTDEGWAALAAEAARNGYSDPLAYVAAYDSGHVNVGFAGYQPGNPHTGFGQVQAYEHAAGESGLPLDQYAAMHTPEALAEARGEPPAEDRPFTPPANFTADGIPIEYGPDGTSIVPNIARELPDGVHHYDQYTGAPLDDGGNIVPGVAYADDGYVFTTALDQRVGLNDDGMRDPAETERLDAEARAAGYESAADHIVDTTRPFPGHPGEPGDLYARPTVEEGRPPIAYSGPDGIYVVTSGGQVLTGEPGGEIEYRGDDGSAVIIPGLKVVTTAPDGTTVSFDPSETSGGPASAPSPEPPVSLPDDTVFHSGDLGPIYNDFPDLIDTDGDGLVDSVRPPAELDPDLDGVPNIVVQTPEEQAAGTGHTPDLDEGGGFGSGAEVPDPRVTTTADDLGGGFAQGADVPDPRVTTTADDLGGSSVQTDEAPFEEHDLDGGHDLDGDHGSSAGPEEGDSAHDPEQDADHGSSSESADLEPAG